MLDVPAEKVQSAKQTMTKEDVAKLMSFDEMMDFLTDKVRSLSTTKSKLQILTLADANIKVSNIYLWCFHILGSYCPQI